MSVIERTANLWALNRKRENPNQETVRGLKQKRCKTNGRNALTREHGPISSELTNIFARMPFAVLNYTLIALHFPQN